MFSFYFIVLLITSLERLQEYGPLGYCLEIFKEGRKTWTDSIYHSNKKYAVVAEVCQNMLNPCHF